jgi:GT2 family glycosyltransferase
MQLRPEKPVKVYGEVRRDIAVVIPTLNRYDLLPRCLTALYSGTWVPGTTTIIDNGMQLDGFEGWHGAGVLRPERRLSVAASWNLGFRETTAPLVLLLNDDFFCGQFTVIRLALAAKKQSGIAAVRGNWGACLLTRALYESVGPFDEQFAPAYHEDCDYRMRLKLRNIRVVNVADSESSHVDHATREAMGPAERAAFEQQCQLVLAKYRDKWGGNPGGETFMEPYDGVARVAS